MARQIDIIEIGCPNGRNNVHAVILSGEASSSSLQDMQRVLADALPEFTDRLRFPIDPRFVGATGAAGHGRQERNHILRIRHLSFALCMLWMDGTTLNNTMRSYER